MRRIKEEDIKKAILSVSMKIYDDEIPATEDIDILIQVAKKHIGMPPVINGKYGSSRCTYCDRVVDYRETYCRQCGQKLDWREHKKQPWDDDDLFMPIF